MDPELSNSHLKINSQQPPPQLANVEPPDQSDNGRSSLWSTYGGIVVTLTASLFSALSYLIIKALAQHDLKSFGAALSSNLVILLLAIPSILYIEYGPGFQNRRRVFEGTSNLNTLGFLCIQGILQGASVVLRTVSIAYLSVGDMTVIVFSSPIVTTILAHFLVGEECGLVFILIAIFTLVGVGLITKPPILTGLSGFDQQTLIGSGLAVGAMLSLSLKFVTTRKIKHIHSLMTSVFGSLGGIFIALPLFLIYEDTSSFTPCGDDIGGILLRIGLVTAFLGIVAINLALQMEDAGVVALVRSFDVIFAFLLQYVFLGVSPDLLSGIGALIVWTGVVMAGLRKYLTNRRKR